MILPWNFCRIFLCVYFNFLPVHRDGIFCMFYVFVEAALCTVVLQQVRKDCGTGEIVDCNDVNSFHIVDLAVNQPSDPSESVDRNFYCAHSLYCLVFRMQSYETKTFGKLSRQPISLQTLNGKK